MDVQAITKYARMSHQKVSEITRQIQGLSVARALDVLQFTPRKSARIVLKTLRSAVANAENNANLAADTLVVKEAVVGTGPTFKRWKASARGMAAPRLRRTCHVKIVVAEVARRTVGAVPAPKPAAKSETKPVEAPKSEQK
ncbi:MAG: 50S ribosomal protein L22 [Verrucomicrobia bacterium GWF2_62_7]|nr:MAG: 50S ribosomal protein L22 [Verrucomicrobia bacterium GWF2_62_7]